MAETNLRAVLDAIERRTPAALVIDSIQTVWLPDSESYAGSITQVRDCTQALVEHAKRTGCATFIVGHVTKDGAIAGPRLLEHLVDTVLYFEGESNGEYRILRAYKNRFGSIDEICVFAMHDTGFARRATVGIDRHARRRPSGPASPPRSWLAPLLVEVRAVGRRVTARTPPRQQSRSSPPFDDSRRAPNGAPACTSAPRRLRFGCGRLRSTGASTSASRRHRVLVRNVALPPTWPHSANSVYQRLRNVGSRRNAKPKHANSVTAKKFHLERTRCRRSNPRKRAMFEIVRIFPGARRGGDRCRVRSRQRTRARVLHRTSDARITARSPRIAGEAGRSSPHRSLSRASRSSDRPASPRGEHADGSTRAAVRRWPARGTAEAAGWRIAPVPRSGGGFHPLLWGRPHAAREPPAAGGAARAFEGSTPALWSDGAPMKATPPSTNRGRDAIGARRTGRFQRRAGDRRPARCEGRPRAPRT